MKKSKKLISVCTSLAIGISICSISVFAQSNGYPVEMPSTGYQYIGHVRKDSSSTTFVNNVKSVSTGQRYDFWGYKIGDKPSNRQTTHSYANGTGLKSAYYASGSQAKNLVGSKMGLTIKTGPSVFNKMFISGTYEP